MINNYEEKKQEKIEAYKKLLEKASMNSNDAYNNAKKIMNFIPLGQPILIGHHSEKRHRGDLEKIDRLMRKHFEESEKEKYYRQKIYNIENNTSISSDDPDAIIKLKAKLKDRIEAQEEMKEINKKSKIAGKGRVFASYQLQNNNANINRIKKRIESLEKKGKELTRIIYKDDKSEILDNVEANRLQIYFNEIPDFEIRQKLKKSGFKWAFKNKCWQRFRSNDAVYLAKKIVNNL